jgi:exosortase/archaeosortase family protein
VLAANVLNLMGYRTQLLGFTNNMPTLAVWGSKGGVPAAFQVAWPCSGVDSLLIYTITILLFLKKSAISRVVRIIYFVIGALVTYFINVLRVVTIFVIAANGGGIGPFHRYYGSLYSITWIVSYPLIIIGSRILWSKIKSRKIGLK